MSHYYGTLKGARGEATRQGHKSSGITSYVATWGGAIRTSIWWHEADQVDMCSIDLVTWPGSSVIRSIYYGRLLEAGIPAGTLATQAGLEVVS